MEMKRCFKCGVAKELSHFYKHPRTSDGRLGKCKECTKKDAIENYNMHSVDSEWCEKERKRGREKYSRLGYKDKQKVWDAKKDWRSKGILKNIHRNLNLTKEENVHHWNYNDGFLNDVFIMKIKTHKRIHKHLELDVDLRLFKYKGLLLNSKQDHYNAILDIMQKLSITDNILLLPF